MSQYLADFGQYDDGQVLADTDEWTEVGNWAVEDLDGFPYDIEEDAAYTEDRGVTTPGNTTPQGIGFAGEDYVSQIDIFCRMRADWQDGGKGTLRHPGVGMRMSDDTGYTAEPTSQEGGEIGIYVYRVDSVSDDDEELIASEGNIISGVEPDNFIHFRSQAEGDIFRVKVWKESEDEPTDWSLEAVDDEFSSGYAGFAAVDIPSDGVGDYDVIGIGTDGDEAPGLGGEEKDATASRASLSIADGNVGADGIADTSTSVQALSLDGTLTSSVSASNSISSISVFNTTESEVWTSSLSSSISSVSLLSLDKLESTAVSHSDSQSSRSRIAIEKSQSAGLSTGEPISERGVNGFEHSQAIVDDLKPSDGGVVDFGFTGRKKSIDIAHIEQLNITELEGASGGLSNSGSGGLIEDSTAIVETHDTLEVWVGETPDGSHGGWGKSNGGAGEPNGENDGGGGGGSTELWVDNESEFIAASDAGGGGPGTTFGGGGARGGQSGGGDAEDGEGEGFGGDGGAERVGGAPGGQELGIADGGTLTTGGASAGDGFASIEFQEEADEIVEDATTDASTLAFSSVSSTGEFIAIAPASREALSVAESLITTASESSSLAERRGISALPLATIASTESSVLADQSALTMSESNGIAEAVVSAGTSLGWTTFAPGVPSTAVAITGAVDKAEMRFIADVTQSASATPAISEQTSLAFSSTISDGIAASSDVADSGMLRFRETEQSSESISHGEVVRNRIGFDESLPLAAALSKGTSVIRPIAFSSDRGDAFGKADSISHIQTIRFGGRETITFRMTDATSQSSLFSIHPKTSTVDAVTQIRSVLLASATLTLERQADGTATLERESDADATLERHPDANVTLNDS